MAAASKGKGTPMALSYMVVDSVANELFRHGAICEAIACWNAVHINDK